MKILKICLGLIFGLFFAIYTFVQVYAYINKDNFVKVKILSGSMYPTLNTGSDYIFSKLKENQEFNRFDVVLFEVEGKNAFPDYIFDKNCPKTLDDVNKCYSSEKINYIKRIVGLPNENVYVKDSFVKIDGEPLIYQKETAPQEFIENGKKELGLTKSKGSFYWGKEGDGINTHWVAIADSYKNGNIKENESVIKLSSDEYFMMGDNRVFSRDSRYFGGVKASSIKFLYE